jgi:uracil-DNA glycosylase family 4
VAAAGSPADVLAASAPDTDTLDRLVADCRACPRLVQWREDVAERRLARRAMYAADTYWGRPVPSWGPADAGILIVGLAPAAHGGNRTGRIFTGDRSGDWLFAALHRAGLANQPTSVSRDDGLELLGCRILAAVHCAPPDNKPTIIERDTCRHWLVRDLQLTAPTVRTIVVLGGFAWTALWPALAAAGYRVPKPRTPFGHGAEAPLVGPAGPVTMLGCYHPSQQNTFTGKLTEPMLDDVFRRAVAYSAGSDL